jgi:probable HAF family extracellular repeat protein
VPGFQGTQARGINNLGQVVGFAKNIDGPAHGFVFDNGTITLVDAPDAQLTTRLFDINDTGQAAGVYDLVTHGYVQDGNGRFTTIDVPGPVVRTIPYFNNNHGEIVGVYIDADEVGHGFFRDQSGKFTTVEFPGALQSSAQGINDHGQIVGIYSPGTSSGRFPDAHAFLLENGVFTNIDVPGAAFTTVNQIDNRGRIVGAYGDAAGLLHGYLRDSNGSITTIDIPGAVATDVQRVTDRDQILGGYIDAAGISHGFLLDEEGTLITVEIPPVSLPRATAALPKDITFVGFSLDPKALHSGFLLADGKFTRLSGPTAFFETFPSNINRRGQVVGVYE